LASRRQRNTSIGRSGKSNEKFREKMIENHTITLTVIDFNAPNL
jgi:hypothetical protein